MLNKTDTKGFFFENFHKDTNKHSRPYPERLYY